MKSTDTNYGIEMWLYSSLRRELYCKKKKKILSVYHFLSVSCSMLVGVSPASHVNQAHVVKLPSIQHTQMRDQGKCHLDILQGRIKVFHLVTVKMDKYCISRSDKNFDSV